MYRLSHIHENISHIFKDPHSEEAIKLIENQKLIHKTWRYKDNNYHILKYDKNVLCLDMIPKTGLLRSVIFNTKGEIMVFSPPKSLSYEAFTTKYPVEECWVEEYVEGTMINMFYDEDKKDWELSTRSTVGGNISFYLQDKKDNAEVRYTFRKMFLEACNVNNLDFDILNRDYCYSFVLQHPQNRIVTLITKPQLYLVRVYKIDSETYEIETVDKKEYQYIKTDTEIKFPPIFHPTCYQDIKKKYASSHTHYGVVGAMLYHADGTRGKIRNPNYEDIRLLRGNQPKLQYQYLALRKEGKVKDYLRYFPESRKSFSKYRDQLHHFTKTLHENYINCFVLKDKSLGEYPNPYKLHMYHLHQNYINNLYPEGKVTRLDTVIQYMNELHPAQQMFLLNHNMRKQTIDKTKIEILEASKG